jgi:hypothetical protein
VNSFAEKIQNALKRATGKNVTYITQLPPGASMEDIQKFVSRNIVQENEDLKAEVATARAKESEVEKQEGKNAVQEEQEILSRVVEHQNKMEIKKNRRIMGLQFLIREGPGKWVPPKNKPKFFLKDDKPYRNAVGVFLVETDDGYLRWFPMLDGDNGKKVRFNASTDNFEDFFRRKNGIVSQLRGGKLDSCFNINPEGKPYFSPDDVFTEEDDNGKLQKVKIVHLETQEIQKYEDRIEEYKQKVNELYGMLQKFQRKEDDYQMQSLEDALTTDSALTRANTTTGALISNQKQTDGFVKATADALCHVAGAQINQRISEGSNIIYAQALEKVQNQLAKVKSNPENKILQQEMLDNIKLLIGATQVINKTMPKQPPQVVVQKPPPQQQPPTPIGGA